MKLVHGCLSRRRTSNNFFSVKADYGRPERVSNFQSWQAILIEQIQINITIPLPLAQIT